MAKMPLLIQVREYNNEYVLTAEFRSDRYSDAFVAGMLEAYEAAMDSMLKNKYVSEVSILSENAVKKIAEFNDTACKYDRTKTISDRFTEMVQTIPDHTAVVFKDKKYTYKELDEISDRLGKYIVSHGIGTEDVVSILIPRCEYMAIAPMGVIKAGAAYQPLDPSYPKDRLMYMLEDSAAKLLIADRELLHLVDGYQGPVLYTDEIMQLEDEDVELKSRSFMTCLSYCIPQVLPGYRRDVCWNMEILPHSVTGTESITALIRIVRWLPMHRLVLTLP